MIIVPAWEFESWKKVQVFVQRPGSTEEEDGVLVFVCLGTSQENTTTYFVVLSPDLEELGRFSAPFPTPLGFHGTWVYGIKLKKK